MGNTIRTEARKKKGGGVEVNKSNSYPGAKRGRRSNTLDVCSHLDLEIEHTTKASKRATAGGSHRMQQQLADLRLGETIRKGGMKGVEGIVGYEVSDKGSDKPHKKKGSKLNIFNSVRGSHKAPPPKHQLDHSPEDVSEAENSQLACENGRASPPVLVKEDELSVSNGSKIVSFSEDSEDISSSVSSSDVSRQESFRGSSFMDFDNVIASGSGYDSFLKMSSSRARGRSVSDSLYHLNGEGKESTIADLKRAKENEKKKTKRFQELSKILAERNIIIELHELSFTRKVGEGAFSEVWEGNWNGIHVAIKKLKTMVDDNLFQERFLREVENLRKGNHQNVVMFFGVCMKPPCIVTEYMAGGNLYDLLHKQGERLSTALVTKMATDLAVGLLHLHSLSILHRDLTSLNILLDEMGNVKISDFGLSREKQQEGSMTMTLGGICNPRWRPPEITKNLGHYSEKVDVYSFALVVWELLTGEIPFANLDGPQAAAQVAYTNLRPVIPPTCPAPLRGLIQRCWVDDPKSRPDFKDIVEELRAIQYANPMGFASELR